jgi:hypothetical protein
MAMHPVERSLFENVRPHADYPLPSIRTRLIRQLCEATTKTRESLSELLYMAATPFDEIFIRVPAVDVRSE